ncbi:hypothetical protein CVV65_02260 [Kyrpidia spormannii]|uniref:ATPase AAA-type core domain-containing protein n=1 Tax=Kyrpidia spormannii TaxID=2055160 RepID=A0A2K8N341_9BACL|nr:hypothetical protein CVV65_02260 [Kyrpidia spormannii]
MGVVLESFQVTNFRAFSNLKIDTLGAVNLIIGKNNSGKSSLLEALRLYSSRGSPAVIMEILNSRNELREPPRAEFVYPEDRPEFTDPEDHRSVGVVFLFHGYKVGVNGAGMIQMGPVGMPDEILSLSLNWYRAVPTQEGPPSWEPVSRTTDEERQDLRSALTIRWGDSEKGRLWLDDMLMRHRRILNSDRLLDRGRLCCYVPAGGLRPFEIAWWWERVALTEEEEDVLKALRLIEPDVERVAMVDAFMPRFGGVPVVRIRGTSFPVPLRSLGDGMNRLFGIILALVNAKNGLLLIDEIENGVHYTVQPELWRIIIHTAKRLNVQVFATTHSWDCIEAFQRALQHGEQDGRGIGYLIRLNRREQGVVATIYDEKDLAVITRDHVEVR